MRWGAAVHPHVCGENATADRCRSPTAGSPPRVWGKRISAHEITGSPPRVWGKRGCWRQSLIVSRFTPTCVGKTSGVRGRFRCLKVHPHVCGENFSPCPTACPTAGSPPRVWGKPQNPRRRWLSWRFTPTCVGKTRRFPPTRERRPVHPHVCGENVNCSLSSWGQHGSPPRVWGKLNWRWMTRRCLRFTPTCVGKTLVSLRRLGAFGGSPPRVWGKRCS